ncbi:MAG: glycosyltransferase family 2 protein, partial [Tepidiformaceae bacterium]
MRSHRVGIVIPARNEAALLQRCLRSILRAADHARAECFVVLVDDGSSDGTAHIARAMLPLGTGFVLSVNRGNVGAARAAGVEHLLTVGAAAHLWVACTDADTVVPKTWISGQLTHANAGADAVAGLVDVDCPRGSALRHAFAKS